jgi:NAD(P)-dependent dehydrogenase (short-subunit alcohol dehydrogenase family)
MSTRPNGTRRSRSISPPGAGNKAKLDAYRGPYATTKAALDALARVYAAETEGASNVRVMVANPGPLRTRMRATLMPGEDPLTLKTPEDFAPKVVAMCAPTWTVTGALYDFPQDRIRQFRAPD